MKKTIRNNILSKIQSGEVKMRSKMEITAEKLGIRGGILLLFLGLIIISGLVSYWVNLNSDLIFGGYGRYGLRIFTQTFPYAIVITFIVLFFILSLILRKFDFSYKKPFVWVLSLIIGLVLVLGWFSLNTPYGKGFYRNEGRFLGMGRMMDTSNMMFGEVIQVSGNTMILTTRDGETITVQTSNNTHYPFGTPKVGNTVRLVGRWNGNYFEAVGIRVFAEDDVGRMGGYGRDGMMNGQGKGPRW